LKIEEIEAFF